MAVEEMRQELGRATPLLAVVDGGLGLLTGYLESLVDNRSDYRTSLTRSSNLGFRAKTPHFSTLIHTVRYGVMQECGVHDRSLVGEGDLPWNKQV